MQRRVLFALSDASDLVLAFETSSSGTKGSAVVKRLATQEFPRPIFVVHLGTKPFKQFRKQIKALGVQPLDPGK